MGWSALTIILVGAAVLAAPDPAASQGVPPEVVARNLAENVLGEGTVRSVSVSQSTREITIVWDSVLYRPTHTKAKNREQVRGEAELATGSIMGVMRPRLIAFTILLNGRPLAQGTRSPDSFTITYAKSLDG